MIYLRWLAWQMVQNKKSVFYIEDLQPNWLQTKLLYRVLICILSALIFGLSNGIFSRAPYSFIGGIIIGFIVGLFYCWGNIELTEHIRWSPKEVFKPENWSMGMVVIVLLAIPLGLIWGWGVGVLVSLIFGLILAASNRLIEMVVDKIYGRLLGGLNIQPDIIIRSYPNDGLYRSLFNGIIISICLGIIGLFAGLLFTKDVGGVTVGLIFGFVGGLGAVIKHIALRITLAYQENVIPKWHYDKFLDYCVKAGLLRKVGGGYIFRHRILLEHFAKLYLSK